MGHLVAEDEVQLPRADAHGAGFGELGHHAADACGRGREAGISAAHPGSRAGSACRPSATSRRVPQRSPRQSRGSPAGATPAPPPRARHAARQGAGRSPHALAAPVTPPPRPPAGHARKHVTQTGFWNGPAPRPAPVRSAPLTREVVQAGRVHDLGPKLHGGTRTHEGQPWAALSVALEVPPRRTRRRPSASRRKHLRGGAVGGGPERSPQRPAGNAGGVHAEVPPGGRA